MASHDYVFRTRWRIRGTCEEISDVLGLTDDLPRWWPAVYLDAKTTRAGDVRGVGKRVELYTKGWLPYTLRWGFEVTDVRRPHGYSIRARGDFIGEGVWTFTQHGDEVEAVYEWRVRAEKGILKHFSFLIKPIFSANHHWAMARGEESLRLELERRRASSAEQRALIRKPPPAVGTLHALAVMFTPLGLLVLVRKLLRRSRRQPLLAPASLR